MTQWNKIYKQYNNGGEAYATLSEDILQEFINLVKKDKFKIKCALDIGCGTGKYLHYLKCNEFATDGIDSSPIAVKMTKKLLKKSSLIKIENMYLFDIPKNKYDLIISVKTIQHGYKPEIKKLINKIYSSLIVGGKVFITLPDYNKKGIWWQDAKEVKKGTYIPQTGYEKDLPHSFYEKKEVKVLFHKFKTLKIITKDRKHIVIGVK